MTVILPKPGSSSPELPGYTTEALAGTYSLFATAMNPGASGPETLLNGLANYGRAVLIIRFFQLIFGASRYAAWFIGAMALGCLGCFMALMFEPLPLQTQIVGIGLFVFLSPIVCFCYFVPYMVRGRILPYRGKLVMHGDPMLNKQMNGDIFRVGLFASALCFPYALVALFVYRYSTVFAGTMTVGEGEDAEPDYTEAKIVTRYYPRPAMDLAPMFLFSPVTAGMAAMGYYNIIGPYAGKFTVTMTVLVLVLLVYGTVLYISARHRKWMTDIAFILSAGRDRFNGYNYLIAFEPNLEEKANNPDPDYDPTPYQEALEARKELDEGLTEYFANMDTVVEPVHVFRD